MLDQKQTKQVNNVMYYVLNKLRVCNFIYHQNGNDDEVCGDCGGDEGKFPL